MCLMLHLYLTLACLFFSFMCVSQDPARSHSSCEERFSPIFNWERAPSISSLHSLLMKSTFNVAGKGRWRTIYISNLGILIFDLLSGCNQGHVRKDQVLLGSCSSPDLHLLILLWTSWMLFFSLWAGMDDGQDASVFSALGNFISWRECSQVDILSLPRRMEAPLFSQRWGLTSWLTQTCGFSSLVRNGLQRCLCQPGDLTSTMSTSSTELGDWDMKGRLPKCFPFLLLPQIGLCKQTLVQRVCSESAQWPQGSWQPETR